MLDINALKPGDVIQQNYGKKLTGVVIEIFYPHEDSTAKGVRYKLHSSLYESWDWPTSLNLVESKSNKQEEKVMKISMDKKYCTRDGRKVRILCVDRKDEFSVVGLIEDQIILFYKEDGSADRYGDETDYDLIEYNPAMDLVLDQPLWVRDRKTDGWEPRHFSYLDKDGNVHCWAGGCTSHTSDEEINHTISWVYWSATKPE